MTAIDIDAIKRIRDLALADADPVTREGTITTAAFLADELRRVLPGDEDAAIARVVTAVSHITWKLMAAHPNGERLTAFQVSAGFAVAAADLAHLDMHGESS